MVRGGGSAKAAGAAQVQAARATFGTALTLTLSSSGQVRDLANLHNRTNHQPTPCLQLHFTLCPGGPTPWLEYLVELHSFCDTRYRFL